MRKPWDCNHPDELVTLRRRMVGTGQLMFGYQCGNCGKVVGVWVKKENIHDQKILPEWDHSLYPKWEQAERAYSLEYRAWRVKQDGVAVFAKTEAEKSRDKVFWDEYDKYLSSEAWHDRRALVLKRAHGVCEGCGLADATQVHHLTYDRVGREMLFDLVAMCNDCHEVVHGKFT